jgi:hypothetical protein
LNFLLPFPAAVNEIRGFCFLAATVGGFYIPPFPEFFEVFDEDDGGLRTRP